MSTPSIQATALRGVPPRIGCEPLAPLLGAAMLAIAGRRLPAGWHGHAGHRRAAAPGRLARRCWPSPGGGSRQAGTAMASIAATSNVGSGELFSTGKLVEPTERFYPLV